MPYTAKNLTGTNLVFKNGYLDIPVGQTVAVPDIDVHWGVFREFVEKGFVEIKEIQEAEAAVIEEAEKVKRGRKKAE